MQGAQTNTIPLRSSIEGALGIFDPRKSSGSNFDSPFEHGSNSGRPTKPRVDPFKKFENFGKPVINPAYRASFDEKDS